MKVSAFVPLALLGIVGVALAGCDGNDGAGLPTSYSYLATGSGAVTADPLTTCSVAREAQQAYSDISAGSASGVTELEQVVTDADSLASSAETANDDTVSLDATALGQEAYSLSDDDSLSVSIAQLQGDPDLTELSLDAETLMLDGGC